MSVHIGAAMNTSKMQTALRREQIAQTALEIMTDQGLRGLSVASIAGRIGLVPSAIYRHFQSKEDIVDAVLDLIHARLLENVAIASREAGNPVRRLERLLLLHIALIKENRGITRIVFAEDMYETRPERTGKVYAIISSYLAEVAGTLRLGQEQGQIRADADPDALSVMFLGLIQPSAILWRLSGGDFDLDSYATIAWTMFEQQIRAGT
jgi:AcrR family transcriptional regulator